MQPHATPQGVPGLHLAHTTKPVIPRDRLLRLPDLYTRMHAASKSGTVGSCVMLLALATLATMALPRASAAARHLVWILAVAALVVLPVFSLLLPTWRILPSWAAVPDVQDARAPQSFKCTFLSHNPALRTGL